jgi:glycerophosphoryl diester phosphodiesterase
VKGVPPGDEARFTENSLPRSVLHRIKIAPLDAAKTASLKAKKVHKVLTSDIQLDRLNGPATHIYALRIAKASSIIVAVLFGILFSNVPRDGTAHLTRRLSYLAGFIVSFYVTDDTRNAVLCATPIVLAQARAKSGDGCFSKVHSFWRASTMGSMVAWASVIAINVFWIVVAANIKTPVSMTAEQYFWAIILPVIAINVVQEVNEWLSVSQIRAFTRQFGAGGEAEYEAPVVAMKVPDKMMKRVVAGGGGIQRPATIDGGDVYKLDRWDIIGDLAAVAQGAVASYVIYVILITSVSLLAVYGLVGYVVHLAVQEWYLPAHATDEAVHAEQLTRAHGAAMHATRQQEKELEEDPEPLDQSSMTTPGVEDQQPEQEEQEPCGPAAGSPPRSSTWQRLPMPARRFLIQFAIQLVAVLVLFFFTHGTYLINGASIKGGEPMVIGHRGVWTTAPGMERVPENSFEACDHAKKYGFHGCEFDVRMTKDKKLVVMHDHTLQRTTTATTGNVDEFTLAELKQLTLTTDQGVPSKTGETVPTLREYLDYIKSIGMIAEVELKQGYDKEIMVAAALDDICRAGMQNMSFMATCEYHYQSILRTIAPDISLERDYLYHTPAGSNNVPTNANILGISNLFLLFNPWVVANSHQAGAGVMVYFVTIENSWLVTFALNLGVDYLMINEGASCIGSGVCPTKKPYKLSRYLK